MPSRAAVAAFLDRPVIARFLIAVILLNGITLGLETSPALMDRIGGLLQTVDKACLAVFVVEKFSAKLHAFGLRFFRSGWNLFDFAIIGISLVPAARSFPSCARCASCGCCGLCQSRQACAG